jgi:hypothetical protein
MNDPDIAFIGGGNMARSLIGGLVARGTPAAAIRVAEPVQALRDGLQRDFGVAAVADNAAAVADAATWVLAVKPQVLRGVCEALAPLAQASRPLVVSIAAGITATQLQRWLGGGIAVVRCMPNTPALLGAGVTGLYANPQVDAAGRQRAETLLAAAGETVWLGDEAKMDAVTAVSGSGAGIAINPRRASRGCAAMAAASAGTSPGRQPCLPASSSMLTGTSTFSGARLGSRCAASAATSLGRSTDCTQSNNAAASRALLDCRWPTRCHSSPGSDSASCLACASCT